MREGCPQQPILWEFGSPLLVFPILTLQGTGRSPGVQVLSQRPPRLDEELGFQLAESANSTIQHDCCKTAWPSYSYPHPGPLRDLVPAATCPGWLARPGESQHKATYPTLRGGPLPDSLLGPWMGQAGYPGPGAQREKNPPPPTPHTHLLPTTSLPALA